MKRIIRSGLSCILAILVLFGAAPLSDFAGLNLNLPGYLDFDWLKLNASAFVSDFPAAPKGFKVSSASYNSVKASWSSVNNATGYVVYRYNDELKAYERLKVTADNYYVNTSLLTGKGYSYKVRAYKTVDGKNTYGTPSEARSAIPIPSKPSSVSAFMTSNSSVKLNWSSVSGATGYVAYRYNSEKQAYDRIKVTSSLTYTNTGLNLGVTYLYKVRAYRAVNGINVYGNPSDAFYAKDIYPPIAPQVNTIYSNSIMVTGKTEPNATILVKSGSSLIGTAKASEKGIFSVSITPQTYDTVLSIVSIDINNNASAALNKKVGPHNPLYDLKVKPLLTYGYLTEEGYTNYQITEAVNIINSLVDSAMTNYEKELAVHDWICENIQYDGYGLMGQDHHFLDIPYCEFSYGVGVCSDFAMISNLLFNLAGIKCEYTSGDADNGQGISGHAWNRIYLDGKPYNLDTTWDSGWESFSQIIYYTSFNKSDQNLYDRKSDSDIKCTDTYYDDLNCSLVRKSKYIPLYQQESKMIKEKAKNNTLDAYNQNMNVYYNTEFSNIKSKQELFSLMTKCCCFGTEDYLSVESLDLGYDNGCYYTVNLNSGCNFIFSTSDYGTGFDEDVYCNKYYSLNCLDLVKPYLSSFNDFAVYKNVKHIQIDSSQNENIDEYLKENGLSFESILKMFPKLTTLKYNYEISESKSVIESLSIRRGFIEKDKKVYNVKYLLKVDEVYNMYGQDTENDTITISIIDLFEPLTAEQKDRIKSVKINNVIWLWKYFGETDIPTIK